MKKTFFTLLALASMYCLVNAATPVCPYLYTAPTIDGDKSEWTGAWLNMDSIVQNTTIAVDLQGGLSAKFQMGYDKDNLYLVFDIKDASMGDTAKAFGTWNSDCAEVMLSLDTAYSGGITGMYQFRKLEGEFDSITDGTIFGNGVLIKNWNANPKCKVKEVDASDGYVQEWQLPWDSLMVRMDTTGAGRGPWEKNQFRLEVQAADNTGTNRTEQCFWAGTSNNAWNQSIFQRVVKLEFPLGINTPQTENKIDVTVTKDMLQLSKVANEITICNITGQIVLQARFTDKVYIGKLASGIYIAK